MARRACERSEDRGQEAIVAVILSVIAVEAFINEMGELVSSPPDPGKETDKEKLIALGLMLNDLEEQGVSLRTKLQMAHYVLTRRSLDKGANPYQDLGLLVRIKNKLVHKKAEVLTINASGNTVGDHDPLLVRLAARGVIDRLGNRQAPQFQPLIGKPKVATWAHNVALEMIVFIQELLPEGLSKVILSISDQRPIPTSR